jgi:glucose-6-phosphate 1-dehydrogenase
MQTAQVSGSSTAFIIFGVTGDLTQRKLIPALYELNRTGRLPQPFCVIGFARRDWDDAEMQRNMQAAVVQFARNQPVDAAALQTLLKSMHYVRASFDDGTGYQSLCSLFADLKIENRLYYLATPPEAYPTIIKRLGDAQLEQCTSGWTRVVIEKPYGTNLASAQALDKAVHGVFQEDQVYRIDHYLGKETVQNILVFRFANGIFDPLWNRHHVDHIQITVSETVGVGSRAGYYETAGVIRDIFQNHLLQLLTLTAMETPVAFNADAVRNEKVKVLQSLRPLNGQDVLNNTYRAQYMAGTIDGKRIPGYKEEVGVNPDSTTETYLAARLFVDNWRWAGVPIYIRSGKALPVRATEISIQFKQVPLSLFNWRNLAGDAPNVLAISIQPHEGITLTFGAKAPGPINTIEPVSMNFDYVKTFASEPPEAYERLILDSLVGDATLFTRSDEVLAAWKYTTAILDGWAAQPVSHLPVYEAGTWGPPGADDFIGREGRAWRQLGP